MFKKSWVVYTKPPFAGPKTLLCYLSRYTHRVAFTNSRLIDCENGKVTFAYRDRHEGDRRKSLDLPADQLIGRFPTHVLPDRLMRIRQYEFLAIRYRKVRLAAIRKLLGVTNTQATAGDKESDWLTQWLESIIELESETCPCGGDRLRQSQLSSKLPPRITMTDHWLSLLNSDLHCVIAAPASFSADRSPQNRVQLPDIAPKTTRFMLSAKSLALLPQLSAQSLESIPKVNPSFAASFNRFYESSRQYQTTAESRAR